MKKASEYARCSFDRPPILCGATFRQRKVEFPVELLVRGLDSYLSHDVLMFVALQAIEVSYNERARVTFTRLRVQSQLMTILALAHMRIYGSLWELAIPTLLLPSA